MYFTLLTTKVRYCRRCTPGSVPFDCSLAVEVVYLSLFSRPLLPIGVSLCLVAWATIY